MRNGKIHDAVRSRARQVIYGLARHRQRHARRQRDHWRLEPAFSDPRSLHSVLNRLGWYAPPKEARTIHVTTTFETTDEQASARDEGEDAAISGHAVPKPVTGTPRPKRSQELVLLWRADSLLRTAWTALSHPGTRIVDPSFFGSAEANTHLRLQAFDTWTPQERGVLLEESGVRLDALRSSVAEQPRVHVLGTGPSLDDVAGDAVRDGVVIACNSIVKSDELLERLRPQVLAFMDPVFHFGVSRYAGRVRDDLQRACELLDPWLVAPLEYAPTLLAHMPDLREKLIVLDERSLREFHVPTPHEPWVRRTGNVLTGCMIPLAVGLAAEIRIYGCDGRDPSDRLFWSHNENAQYSDLYQTVMDSHPSFFDDRDYVDYYVEHCEAIARQCAWAEREHGTRVLSASASHIPALKVRAIE